MARAAAVSRQTVSNVLNGSGRVGDAARARVLAAVEALGYHPHHGARSLRSRRTRQFAYVMPQVQLLPGNYIMQQFLQSLAAACARRSYSLVTVVPEGDPRDEMRRLIASRSVDAFLLSELQQDDARVKLLTEARMPFACFGRTGPALPQNWVDIDNRGAVAAAVGHVLARGFGRIAFVGYRTPNYWDTERVAGFRDGLAAGGVSADQADVLLVDDASARRKIRSLLSAGRPELRPDAIVTSSDRLAGVVYSVAAELRLRIGQDLAVTGFDGSAAAALMHPRLTTVAVPVDDIARQVVARALRQLDHGAGEEPGELVPATLRLGESTGGPGRELDRARPRELDGPAGNSTNPPREARTTPRRCGNDSRGRRLPWAVPWPNAASPSRTWRPTPGSGSARSPGCSTGATRCASPRCGRCSTRSTGSATGRATPPRPWSAARRGPWRSSSPT